MTAKIIRLSVRETRLRKLVLNHLAQLGFHVGESGLIAPPCLTKETYRAFHAAQRQEKLEKNAAWLSAAHTSLLRWFAAGTDIDASRIQPELELVRRETWQSDLFRLAALYWQIPVSDGYGRRMRFLVWDRSNDKLLGLIALGDAVFNQAARDSFIGWDHNRRKDALVNLMDAYVLGALPPYNMLLGGKLVASLISTREVQESFAKRYAKSVGVISGERKRAKLVAVTTTSALGRSSVYNRMRLAGQSLLQPIGYTSGFGHFHFSGEVFDELRRYLEDVGDDYAEGFCYGTGPNWRIRVIRKALSRLNLDPNLVRHGFAREVFISRLATNAEAYLRGDERAPDFGSLPSVEQRSREAVARWVTPRSVRDKTYLAWTPEQLLSSILGQESTTNGRQRIGLGT